MSHHHRALTPALVPAILIWCAALDVSRSAAMQAPAPTASTIRMVSVASGTRGEERSGRFVLLDPRNTFKVPDDTQIIVSFEWLGTPGKHQLSGTWKGPGGLSVTSAFEYVAPGREFSAYWTLPITSNAPLGSWSFEAHVDGQPGGTHTFALVGPDGAIPPAAPKAPIPLTRTEMATRVLSAAVSVEAVDANDHVLGQGPGTLLNDNTVATAFGIINGAVKIRVKGAGGRAVELTDLLGYDRRRDWALLGVSGVAGPDGILKTAAPPAVGTQCATVSASAGGAFAVTSCEVVGVNEYPEAGLRLSLSLYNGNATPGAPLVNEFGELVGVISEGLTPGAGARIMTMRELQAPPTLAIPSVALEKAGGTPMPLANLAARGVFTPPVVMARHVLSGGFASKIFRDGGRTQPVDQRTEFSTQDAVMTVFVTWDPKEKLKTVLMLRLFDQENRLLGETKPMKTTLQMRSLPFTTWEMKVPPAPGLYRVDVLVGSDVAWRGFFTVAK